MEQSEISKIDVWKMAIRPHTLPAAIGPVLVGAGFAITVNQFRLFPSLAALIGAVLLQILSNLGNDYYDFLKGYDTKDRVGFTRTAASGLLSIKELKLGILINIILAVLTGIYILFSVLGYSIFGVNGVVVIITIGVLSIIFSLLYSGGPYPLSVLGLGDVFVLIFFGFFAVMGTYFVNTGSLSYAVFIGSFAPGFLITAILVVNNYRDYESDKAVGKNTLIVRFGQRFGQTEYFLLLLIPYIILFVLFFFYENFSIFIFLPILTLWMAKKNLSELNPNTPKERLNPLLGKTAKLSMYFSILFAIGLAI